jgi:4-amino-4-deoxy-L-arabinose transferase-like glycosyltransferase
MITTEILPVNLNANTERSRLMLPLIMCCQAAISLLALRNTAFEDEALYLFAGRQIVNSWRGASVLTDRYDHYFSGFPAFHPVIAGMLDMVGGIEAARMFSLFCMLGVTACVFCMTIHLFDRKSAILAAALFSCQGTVLFLGRLATYDSVCLLLLALATVLVMHVSTARNSWWAAGLGPLLSFAVAAKYAGVLFAPTILALLIWRTLREQSWKTMLSRTGIALCSLAVVSLIVFTLPDEGVLQGFSSTTINRVISMKTAPGVMVDQVVEWSGAILALALVGLILNGMGDLCTGLLLFCSSLLVPAYHIYKGEMVSLHKHIAFGLFFIMPLAGYTVTRLFSHQQKNAFNGYCLAGLAIYLFIFFSGLQQAYNLYHGWASSSGLMRLMRTQVRLGGDRYLAEECNVSRYYLQDVTYPWQWTSLDFFIYRDKGNYERTGDDAYLVAIDEGYFNLVELTFGYRAALAKSVDRALRASKQYELVEKLPYQNTYGPGYRWLWRKKVTSP